MKKIEILGVGCARCEKTEQVIRRTLQEMNQTEGSDFTLTKIKDPVEIASRGVLMTPGIVIDGKVVSSGKIPNQKEITKWFE